MRTCRSRVGQLHATSHSRHLRKPTVTLLMYFLNFLYDVISAYLTYNSFNSPMQEKNLRLLSNPMDGIVYIGLSCKLSKTASYFSSPSHNALHG